MYIFLSWSICNKNVACLDSLYMIRQFLMSVSYPVLNYHTFSICSFKMFLVYYFNTLGIILRL